MWDTVNQTPGLETSWGNVPGILSFQSKLGTSTPSAMRPWLCWLPLTLWFLISAKLIQLLMFCRKLRPGSYSATYYVLLGYGLLFPKQDVEYFIFVPTDLAHTQSFAFLRSQPSLLCNSCKPRKSIPPLPLSWERNFHSTLSIFWLELWGFCKKTALTCQGTLGKTRNKVTQ